VGGGHGQLLGPLLDAGHDVTVYGSADVCRDRIEARLDGAPRARFQAGDLLRAPWPAGAFDVVVSYRLLPHVAAWKELLGELCRLARRAVLVDYPTRRSVNAAAGALFAAKKSVEGDTRPFAVFRDAEIEAALAAHGFRASSRRPEFFFPMALHRALGMAPVSRSLEAAARGLGLARVLGSPVILRAEPRG
jgi:2-polyprenyl-3-methyl-5-hydroxy-6-metoxy-1,4-benzoquinol methylase